MIAVSLSLILNTSPEVPTSINIRKSKTTANAEVEGGNRIDGREIEENLSNIKSSETRCLNLEARIAFTHLKKAFIKAPIFNHLNLQCHI